MNRVLFFLGWLACIIAIGCAKSGTLTGGPKDETPPVLIKDKSPQNFQTNFSKQDLVFEFDEYIVLKNAAKEVVVTPPLTYRLQTKVRGKKVIASFNDKEVLKDSVTYLIDFGTAIQDFREGNIRDSFQYVFSTGPNIDSLEINGQIIDLVTQKPVKKGLVLLYDEDRDSVIYDGRAFYLTKADEDGYFNLKYLTKGNYRLYALNDENENKVFNLGNEAIGFLSQNISLDTTNIDSLKIAVSIPDIPLRLLKSTVQDSQLVTLLFNQEIPRDFYFEIVPPTTTWSQLAKDTLKIWHTNSLDSFSIVVPLISDTATVNLNSDKAAKSALVINANKTPKRIRAGDSLVILASAPIASITMDSISVSDTTGREYVFEMVASSMRPGLTMRFNDSMVGTFQVMFPDSCMTDIYGRPNDSTIFAIDIVSDSLLAEVNLEIVGLDTISPSLIKVSTDQLVLIDTLIAPITNKDDTINIAMDRLIDPKLTIEIVTDVNGNGTWDAVQLIGRQQAEPKVIKEVTLQSGVVLRQMVDVR